MPTPTTNRLLGHPDDARLLLVNADDFGMCHAINTGIVQAITGGIVASTSLMTPCPWAPEAMRLLREHPEIPFGVHLTLTCDFAAYRWGPVSDRGEVASLLDEAGHLFPNKQSDELLANARIEEIEREFRAQIDSVLAAGLAPAHLDWHALPDGGREDTFDLTLALAREHRLALRVHDRDHAARCQQLGLPVNDHLVLDSYAFDPATKAETFARLLRELPAGLSEWALHPSTGDEEHRAMEPGTWRIRRADLDFACSPEARLIIESEGIAVDHRIGRHHPGRLPRPARGVGGVNALRVGHTPRIWRRGECRFSIYIGEYARILKSVLICGQTTRGANRIGCIASGHAARPARSTP